MQPTDGKINALGGIVICQQLGPALARRHYENKALVPPRDAGLPGWQRAHSQGPGTGFESMNAISFVPRDLNLKLQNAGIEARLRKLYELAANCPQPVEVWLTTETYRHPGTDMLKQQIYRVDAVHAGQQVLLFEADIECGNDKIKPRITVSVDSYRDSVLAIFGQD
jgi:hypothetical protein